MPTRNYRFVHTTIDAMFGSTTSHIYSQVLSEAISLTAAVTPKHNETIVIWTHIAKSATATWSKAVKNAANWTHINKSNQ